jgi:hypothetical protein
MANITVFISSVVITFFTALHGVLKELSTIEVEWAACWSAALEPETLVLVVEETANAKKALAGMAIEGTVMVEMAAAAEMIAESQRPRILQ